MEVIKSPSVSGIKLELKEEVIFGGMSWICSSSHHFLKNQKRRKGMPYPAPLTAFSIPL